MNPNKIMMAAKATVDLGEFAAKTLSDLGDILDKYNPQAHGELPVIKRAITSMKNDIMKWKTEIVSVVASTVMEPTKALHDL